ncbi:MAG: choice-of-anchor D domain-containing protein [Planctomycetes bacterium]|nr:choice-of-anchor D domain-containing protein [Planctomycetota bacterium]
MKPILMIALLMIASSLAAQNTPPTITITMNGAPVPAWSIQYVAGGTTIAALNLQITVDDAEGSNTSLDAIVANGGGTDAAGQLGINYLEWASFGMPVAYTVTPTSGSFSNGGAQGSSGSSEIFNIWFQAWDGTDTTVTGFKIWVNPPAQPPTLTVTQAGLPVANTGQLIVADGTTLASLALAITADDPANEDVTLSGSIDDAGTTGMQASEFSSVSAATPYSIQPATGTFHQPGFVHVIRIWAQNQTGTKFLFEFSIVVANAAPSLAVTAGGVSVQSGQAATGTPRDFGTIPAGTTAGTLHVVIQNTGNTELHLGTPTISTGGGDFTVITTGFSATLPIGSSTSFDVEFDPSTPGDWMTTISFTHDAPTGSTFDLAVHGAATLAGAPTAGGGGSGGGGCTAEIGGSFGVLVILGMLLYARRKRFA